MPVAMPGRVSMRASDSRSGIAEGRDGALGAAWAGGEMPSDRAEPRKFLEIGTSFRDGRFAENGVDAEFRRLKSNSCRVWFEYCIFACGLIYNI